jgi:hypothetical protein
MGKKLSGSGIFSCRIVCGDCGSFYGSKVWNSTRPSRRTIWQCNRKYHNEDTCKAPHLTEAQIKEAFVTAFSHLIGEREPYIAEYTTSIALFTDTANFDLETAQLQIECSEAMAQADYLVNQNAQNRQNQAVYEQEYASLVAKAEVSKARLETIKCEKREKIAHREKLRRFLTLLESITAPITAFDEALWQAAVEKLVIKADSSVTVVFRSGTEIQVGLHK